MQVQDIMSHPVTTVKATATVQFAIEMMALHEVGALPVTSDEILVGIVTDRDIVLRALAPGLPTTTTEVAKIMTTRPLSVAPNAPVEEAARTFTNMRIRRLPVVEDGHPVGMLTTDDIARQWDNDAAILLMSRRVAPRHKGHPALAQR
jgi:CBS domain-containing protein